MEHLVRARTLLGYKDLIRKLGADPAATLARAGLKSQARDTPNLWIPFRNVLDAYDFAAEDTACPSFGLRLGNERDLSYLGPLILIFRYSDTLESGMRSSTKYLSIQNTGFRVNLDIREKKAAWVFLLPDELRRSASQWIEESMFTALRLIRIFLGEHYLPLEIRMQHEPLSSRHDYEHYLGRSVSFGAAHDAMIFDRTALNVPNPLGDQEMFRFLSGYLDSRVMNSRGDISAAVSGLLRTLIPTGKFSLDIVADQLAMHRRTLQRRLDAAGQSYIDILDQCRAELATDYLQTSNLPIVNLAHMLGYADQSSFNHAFKRWYGVSPKQWQRGREKNISQDSAVIR